jgi:hypothetical protein
MAPMLYFTAWGRKPGWWGRGGTPAGHGPRGLAVTAARRSLRADSVLVRPA